jgi:DNA-binding HxlR family transcriptional regulator
MDTEVSNCEDPRTEALVHEMLGRIADRWTLIVIDVLGEGEMRFSRLQERITGVSQKMLTKTLRQLERDGLVSRHVYAEVPSRVEYRLTELGESLGEVVCSIWEWAAAHRCDVEEARRAYQARSATESA